MCGQVTGEDSKDNIYSVLKSRTTWGHFFYSIPQTGRLFAESPPIVSAVSDTVDDFPQNFPWPRTACFECRGLL